MENFDKTRQILDKLQSSHYNYINDMVWGCAGYIEYVHFEPLSRHGVFVVCFNSYLKDEWIKDLIDRYEKGIL